MRRNILYGPGINVFNMSAAKSFGLPWEGVRIEFRADAANVFNHKSLSTPGGLNLGKCDGCADLNPGDAYTSANSISSVTTGARNLQLMFRVSF